MTSNLPPGVTDADIEAQDDGFGAWYDSLTEDEITDILHEYYIDLEDAHRQDEQEHRDDVARGC